MSRDDATVKSRIDEARSTARELLNEIENQDLPVERCLMKAKRLARLLRDSDAQKWLDYELKGYPVQFSFSELGTCRKYVESAGRVNEAGDYWKASLPSLEARCKAEEATLSSISANHHSGVVENFTVARATADLMLKQFNWLDSKKDAYQKLVSILSSLKGSIHSYATECFLAIEFGDIVQGIFEQAREDVDAFIRAKCPEAAEKVVAINERMRENDAESRAAALTSCRRLLMTVADAIFPASEDSYIDGKGKTRKVGQEQYKNRIIAFLEKNIQSESTAAILKAEIEYLAARLDAVYEKACKGVHDAVTLKEARLAVIQTYLMIAEVSRLGSGLAS